MPNTFHHIRVQRPVGQGFFHTALLQFGNTTFRYVYDCGSDNGKALKREIRHYGSRPEIYGGSKPKDGIDLFFLSHFHSDHVNGAMELARRFTIETVVLPYLTDGQKLEWILQAVDENAFSEEYMLFVRDPASWYSNHGVKRVIFIRPSEEGERDPGIEGEPVPYDPEKFEGNIEINFKALRRAEGSSSETPDGGVERLEMKDSTPLTFTAGQTGIIVDWMLWTFVPHVKDAKKDILDALVNEGPFKTPQEAEKAMRDPNVVFRLAEDRDTRNKILAAYAKAVGSKPNRASMCLYSGPIRKNDDNFKWGYWTTASHCCDWWDRPWRVNGGVGWLGTGDMEFNFRRHRNEFKQHYSSIKKNVSTVTLPHHGSGKDFHPELIYWGWVFVASAGESSTHGHPDIAVIHAVMDERKSLHLVTEQTSSVLIESVCIRVRTH